jgi:hypothetical protein
MSSRIFRIVEGLLNERNALPSGERSKINAALSKAGLDGNGKFGSIAAGMNTVAGVLDDFNIEQSELFSAPMNDQSGRTNLRLSRSNKADPFSPSEFTNTMLVFTWYKRESGNYECVAYVS